MKYQIDIASNTLGHESLMQELEEAVSTITTRVKENALWVFINGTKFEFTGSDVRSEQNQANLTQAILAAEEPRSIVLTGELRGGGK
jgi:hypothetical protein